jgi:MFS superfamily sulfate permease-like transporter
VTKSTPSPLGSLRHDLPAGLVVFLVALPLCLGIAHASGAPPIAGIVTGMVGGLLVAWLSGSQTSVSGPAAGLLVIVLAAINDIGYGGLLLATVLCGGIQLAFGVLRLGALGRFFPSSVIKGMLVAIGVILVLKQIPHAVGWGTFEGDEAFVQPDGMNTFTEIPFALGHMHLGALILSVVGLVLVVAAERVEALRRRAWLPGPLLAVVAGLGLNALFFVFAPSLAVGGDLLTQVPNGSPSALWYELASPAWSMIGDLRVWTAAVTLAIIASIETLLCVEAVDGLDPLERKSPLNRELLAQGVGNAICGLIGGIPMTAVIVRGSANIQAGAKTRMSSFFHGILLLAAVLVVPGLINLIPLASLAAVLLYVGYKLARPQIFLEMFRRNQSHWAPFIVTVATIVLTDLLTGVIAGLVLAIVFMLVESVLAQRREPRSLRVKLGPVVPLLSKLIWRRAFERVEDGADVLIDGTDADVIHDDLREEIKRFEQAAESRRIRVEVRLPAASAAGGH